MQVNISVQRDGEMVTMQTREPLPPRRLWTALILPYDCVVDMQVTELSKLNGYDYSSTSLSASLLPLNNFRIIAGGREEQSSIRTIYKL